MRPVAIGLGSSLGDRAAQLRLAVARLGSDGAMRLVRASRWVRTPPLTGGAARGWFLNGVALFDTALEPEQILDRCIAAEVAAGRRRARRWGDRTLDLDVLLVAGRVEASARLVLPHPAIGARPFVLEPLLEVWPDAIDPTTGRPYASYRPARGPRPVPWGILAARRPVRYL